MFGKFLSKIQKDKPSHPLATDGGIDAILADIPVGNPIHRLLDLAHWLDDVERFRAEIGLAALGHAVLRLDAFARPARDELIAGYLDPRSPHHLSEATWGQLDSHARMLVKAYRIVLTAARTAGKTGLAPLDLAAWAASAVAAQVLVKKLQRFRYRNPDAAWWRETHDLLADTAALGVLAVVVPLYGNPQERRNPLQCYLAGLYLELAPLGNLVPQQVEALDRFLDLHIEHLELVPERRAGSSHAIDLGGSGGPVKLAAQDPVGASLRYCSVRRLQMSAVQLAAQIGEAAALPEWVQLAACDRGGLQSLLMSLILNWSEKPPQRAASREARSGRLKVVHGFDLARRMVSYTSYARAGYLPDYDGLDLDAMFDEVRFGRVRNVNETPAAGTETPLPPLDPLAILEQLELSGDRQMMEAWDLVDESAGGIGAVAPGLLSRHRIGGLVCFRRGDDIDWRPGIIRRIGRDAKKQPSIGIEAFGWLALCAVAHPPSGGEPKAPRLGNKVDAILPAANGDDILLPAGAYRESLRLDVTTNEGTVAIVLTKLTESDGDFERAKFAAVAADGAA